MCPAAEPAAAAPPTPPVNCYKTREEGGKKGLKNNRRVMSQINRCIMQELPERQFGVTTEECETRALKSMTSCSVESFKSGAAVQEDCRCCGCFFPPLQNHNQDNSWPAGRQAAVGHAHVGFARKPLF